MAEFDLVQQIYSEVRQINERLNTLSLSFVPRPEYEKLHTALGDQVRELSDKVDKLKQDMERDQFSRQERFWTRIGPIVAVIALLLSFLQFFSHIQFK